MQTFLPHSSFVKSMEVLDWARLGKQRVEAAQILEIITGLPVLPKNLHSLVPFNRSFKGWSRHPAVLMWVGHEEWLKLYLDCCIGEWWERGYSNSIAVPAYDTDIQSAPPWLGFEEFHQSHRSNLLRKLPSHYRTFWPDESPDLPYYWPTKKGF